MLEEINERLVDKSIKIKWRWSSNKLIKDGFDDKLELETLEGKYKTPLKIKLLI